MIAFPANGRRTPPAAARPGRPPVPVGPPGGSGVGLPRVLRRCATLNTRYGRGGSPAL